MTVRHLEIHLVVIKTVYRNKEIIFIFIIYFYINQMNSFGDYFFYINQMNSFGSFGSFGVFFIFLSILTN